MVKLAASVSTRLLTQEEKSGLASPEAFAGEPKAKAFKESMGATAARGGVDAKGKPALSPKSPLAHSMSLAVGGERSFSGQESRCFKTFFHLAGSLVESGIR